MARASSVRGAEMCVCCQTGGSLAQQQKDLVAQKQKQMAQHVGTPEMKSLS